MSQETPVTEEKVSPRIQLRNDVVNLLNSMNVSAKAVSAVSELMTPKKGMVLDIDSVTHKDSAGNITEIQCSLSGIYLPATEEYFYVKPTSALGFDRNSKQATKLKLEVTKRIAATKANVFTDILAGTVTAEQAKAIVDAAEAEVVDYSTVGVHAPVAE